MTARHSGKAGDIIFALPVMRALGIDTIYIPENTGESKGLKSNLIRLLYDQDFIASVRSAGDYVPYLGRDVTIPRVDFDLDLHRTHLDRGGRNMVLRYADVFNVELDEKAPWINEVFYPPALDRIATPYDLFHVTQRHRGSVDWDLVMNIRDDSVPAFFVGTVDEYRAFSAEVRKDIWFLRVADLKDFAIAIKRSRAFYCNQSVGLALAQGMGKEYWWERKTGKTNCVFNTENQHEILVTR